VTDVEAASPFRLLDFTQKSVWWAASARTHPSDVSRSRWQLRPRRPCGNFGDRKTALTAAISISRHLSDVRARANLLGPHHAASCVPIGPMFSLPGLDAMLGVTAGSTPEQALIVVGMKDQGFRVSLGDHGAGRWIAVFY
jgi:hypothetical protein